MLHFAVLAKSIPVVACVELSGLVISDYTLGEEALWNRLPNVGHRPLTVDTGFKSRWSGGTIKLV